MGVLKSAKGGQPCRVGHHVPGRRSRENNGRAVPVTTETFAALGSADPPEIQIVTRPQPDFPLCHHCLAEMTILPAEGGGPRRIMCHKTFYPSKWVAVPADRAQKCTQTAAPLTIEEQRAFLAEES